LSIYNKGKKSSKLSDAVNILQGTQNGQFSGEKANNFSVALLDSEITTTCRNLSTLFPVVSSAAITLPLLPGNKQKLRHCGRQYRLRVVVLLRF